MSNRTWWLWAPDQVLITLDSEGRVNLWNAGAERLFGVSAASAAGRTLGDVAPAPAQNALQDALTRARAAQGPVDVRSVAIPTRLGTRYLDVRCSPFAPSGETATHYLFVGTDVTEHHGDDVLMRALNAGSAGRRRPEAPFPPATDAASAAGHRGPLSFLADSVIVVARDDSVLLWPASTTALFGVHAGEAVGRNLYDLLPFLDEPRVRAAAARAVLGITTTVDSLNVDSLPRLEGARLRVVVSPARTSRDEGDYLLVASVEHGSLRAGQNDEEPSLPAHFAAVADAAEDPMVLLAPDGSVLCANGPADRLFDLGGDGLPRPLQELLGSPIRPPPDFARPEVRTVRLRGKRKGRPGPACALITWPVEAAGTAGLMGLFLDAAHRDRREERLLRDRDLLLVYNRILTHDVGNLLMAMTNYLQLAEASGVSDKARPRLKAARGIATEISALLENVRILSAAPRREGSRGEPVDGHEALASALAMAAVAYPTKNVRPLAPPGPAWVYADRTLAPVFYNLISNALRHNPKPDAFVEARAEFLRKDGEAMVRWTIADNGPGTPDNLRAPRPLAECTNRHGLGLAIAHALVARWGGAIQIGDRVAGDPGQGTAVHLTLTLTETTPAAPRALRQRTPEPHIAGRSARPARLGKGS